MAEQYLLCGVRRIPFSELLTSEGQAVLITARKAGTLLLCGCQHSGIPMVGRLINGRIHVARWPDTGHLHSITCPAFDPSSTPDAIKALDDGTLEIRTAFSFKVSPSSGADCAVPPSKTVFHAGRQSLGLAAFLRELWRLSELDKWAPGMAGHRSWGVVRYRLLNAAVPIMVQGEPLLDRLFVPEPYRRDIPRQSDFQVEALINAIPLDGMAMLIAPIKAVTESRYGIQLSFTHLPSMRCFGQRDDELMGSIQSLDEDHRLIGVALLQPREGYFKIADMETICVTGDWLPCQSKAHGEVIDRLVDDKAMTFVVSSAIDASEIAIELRHGEPFSVIRLAPERALGWRRDSLPDQ